ncbi:MAG: hypothetical protein EXS13_01960 [Planctomycetes bacterium]|nr:hypothetical protein [Planctomycetota bacterium]
MSAPWLAQAAIASCWLALAALAALGARRWLRRDPTLGYSLCVAILLGALALLPVQWSVRGVGHALSAPWRQWWSERLAPTRADATAVPETILVDGGEPATERTRRPVRWVPRHGPDFEPAETVGSSGLRAPGRASADEGEGAFIASGISDDVPTDSLRAATPEQVAIGATLRLAGSRAWT